MKLYIKKPFKPVQRLAIQWDGREETLEILRDNGAVVRIKDLVFNGPAIIISHDHLDMDSVLGYINYFIIKDLYDGSFYACHPDGFKMQYEEIKA